MRLLERDHMAGAPYNPAARYVRLRRLLVDWLSELAEDHELQPTTTHAAVQLLDRFLQSMDVHRTRYQLVAMACFLIAGAFVRGAALRYSEIQAATMAFQLRRRFSPSLRRRATAS